MFLWHLEQWPQDTGLLGKRTARFLTHGFLLLTLQGKGNFCQMSRLFFTVCHLQWEKTYWPGFPGLRRKTCTQSLEGCLFIADEHQLPDSGLKSCTLLWEAWAGQHRPPLHSHLDDLRSHQERDYRCQFPGPHSNKDSEGKVLETNTPGFVRRKMSASCSQALSPFWRFHCQSGPTQRKWIFSWKFRCCIHSLRPGKENMEPTNGIKSRSHLEHSVSLGSLVTRLVSSY